MEAGNPVPIPVTSNFQLSINFNGKDVAYNGDQLHLLSEGVSCVVFKEAGAVWCCIVETLHFTSDSVVSQ